MSTDNTDPDVEPTREERLKSLIRKDIDPEITRLAKRTLNDCQEGSS